MDGRVILVVGGSRGIGRAVADECRRRGATVVATGRSDADVRDAAATEALVARVVETHGRVDVVVHSAAAGGSREPVWESEDFADVMATNVTGAYHVARALLAWAKVSGARTRFVALSSEITVAPVANAAAYTTSKHALEGLVRALAADAADHGVRATITAVRLGAHRTDMNQDASLPPPEDAVPLVIDAMTAPDEDVHGRVTSRRPSVAIDRTGADLFASPVGPSPRVRAALARMAERDDLGRYPDGDLRAAIAKAHAIDVTRVVVGAGASDLLERALRVLTRPGERIVANAPSWPLFPALCARVGLVTKRVSYTIDADRRRADHDLDGVARAIDATTRAVYLVSPSNPMGIAIDHDDFARFLARVPSPVKVIVDEAYADWITRPDALRATAFADRVVVLRSFSKLHALAALRLGYAVGPAPIVAALDEAGLPFAVSRAALVAGAAAIADEGHVERARRWVTEERERLMAACAREGVATLASDTPFFLVRDGNEWKPRMVGRWTETTSASANV